MFHIVVTTRTNGRIDPEIVTGICVRTVAGRTVQAIGLDKASALRKQLVLVSMYVKCSTGVTIRPDGKEMRECISRLESECGLLRNFVIA